MNGPGQGAEPQAADHGQGQFRDHFAGVAGYNRCAQNGIGAGLGMDFHKAVGIAFEHGPVYLAHLLAKGLDGKALLFRLMLIQTDMRDFRVGIGTPRHG